jgi:RNA polymerase sigma factor (sigma-70 family)
LTAADADDVIQETWLELLEQVERIREPAAIAGWLGTVARRKALRRMQSSVREQLSGDPGLGDSPTGTTLDADLLAAEQRDVVRRAIATLPSGHRELMTALLAHPDLDYCGLGSMLAMPVGSIGPTRARCLERLRRHPAIRGLRD